MEIVDLSESLRQAGVLPDSVVPLHETPGPKHIRYLDLVRIGDVGGTPLPDAVIESSGQPFLYVARADVLGAAFQHEESLGTLVRLLACRSDARYLAIVYPGRMDVYPVGVFGAAPDVLVSDALKDGAFAAVRGLLSGSAKAFLDSPDATEASHAEWIESLLYRLLTAAADGIRTASNQLSIEQVLSLVGRALFFRFLVDRNIVCEKDLREIAPSAPNLASVFRTAADLADVCRWLDRTFNGDLFSVGPDGYDSLLGTLGDGTKKVCWHLSNIQEKAVGGQLSLDWGGIQFRHVPVDVLSQVYEDFAHRFVPELAKATSIHFTPRRLAEMLLDGAFSAVTSSSPHAAKVLDPAVGGGVFLVLALKRLVAEKWRNDGVRPDRATIRKILMTQLAGLDINHDALNVTALSLYLVALELDPDPRPLSALKFKKLIGSVLYAVDAVSLATRYDIANVEDASLNVEADAQLGSLARPVLRQFKGAFDIVVGNPPWTAFKGQQAVALNATMGATLVEKPNDSPDPQANPESKRVRYGSPDIAFLLAATHWAKVGGALGFAIHARFLFQNESFALRKLVFERMRVTGIMNFATLRQERKIWPMNDAPCALIVARNDAPSFQDSFYFISPALEPRLAAAGQFRVDPRAAAPVPLRLVGTDPMALKKVFKGGLLGLDLLARVSGGNVAPVRVQLDRHDLKFSSGYQMGKLANRTRSAKHLRGLPIVRHDMEFVAKAMPGGEFSHEQIQWPRSEHIYLGPLLLFRESPQIERRLRGALYSAAPAAYSESFFGMSINGRPELGPLLDALYVLSYSDLFLYYQLLTSAKFGVERPSSLQSDLEEFPLVWIAELGVSERELIAEVAERLRRGEPDWVQLNSAVARLYDLSSSDEQLITDTLDSELPFLEIAELSTGETSDDDRAEFFAKFNELVTPFQHADEIKWHAFEIAVRPIDGWVFMSVSPSKKSTVPTQLSQDLAGLARVAESYWATRIKLKLSDGSMLIGQIDQRRYWSRTQARLLALEWLQADYVSSTLS